LAGTEKNPQQIQLRIFYWVKTIEETGIKLHGITDIFLKTSVENYGRLAEK
jgi:hypothetical protein